MAATRTGIPDGYVTDAGFDPAEDHIGPFYYRRTREGYSCAFRAAARHCNLMGSVHGGVLMSFADFALCLEATDAYAQEQCVTVSFSCEFIAAGELDDLILAGSEILRKTRSLVFLRGQITNSRGEKLMAFSSVVKRLPGN